MLQAHRGCITFLAMEEEPYVDGWWSKNAQWGDFRRMGIKIKYCCFLNKEARANVVLTTGWGDSVIKYSDTVQYLHERGFNVFSYDHQSQGLSGRWLMNKQTIYVESFEDYVDDFVYFVTTTVQGYGEGGTNGGKNSPGGSNGSALPMYVIGCSMGGLIASIAMSRQPTLFNRAVLVAPMLRNKCATKYFDFKYPVPQPLVYWISWLACYLGLGQTHVLGFFEDKPEDPLKLNITTSDIDQLHAWQLHRHRNPGIMSSCITVQWLLESIRAQKKFSYRYKLVRTNTLIMAAENDRFVHNRAMAMFLKQAPNVQMFFAPDSFHDLLNEKEGVRGACLKAVTDFFSQKMDDVLTLQPSSPLIVHDATKPIYSYAETLVRMTGLTVGALGLVAGAAMMLSDVGARSRR